MIAFLEGMRRLVLVIIYNQPNGLVREVGMKEIPVQKSIRHMAGLAVMLIAVWLAWSGHFTNKLILTFGVVSIALTLWCSRALGSVDDEAQPSSWGIRPVLYAPYILKEIVLANVDVIKRILSPNLSEAISPRWIKVPTKQRTRLGQVVFANSITLTPGTVSVMVSDDYILVHALSNDGAEGLLDGGEMGERVCKLEGS